MGNTGGKDGSGRQPSKSYQEKPKSVERVSSAPRPAAPVQPSSAIDVNHSPSGGKPHVPYKRPKGSLHDDLEDEQPHRKEGNDYAETDLGPSPVSSGGKVGLKDFEVCHVPRKQPLLQHEAAVLVQLETVLCKRLTFCGSL
jgi:hypothetical protein